MPVRLLVLPLALGLLAAGAAGPPRTAQPFSDPASDRSVTVPAAADAYTRSDTPNTAYGGAPRISAENDTQQRVAYLRFDVPQPPEGQVVDSATLVLRASTAATRTGVEVREVRNAGWDEGTLTAANAPRVGTVLDRASAYRSGSSVELQVAAAVRGAGPVSLALTTAQGGAWSGFSSREGRAAPRLVVWLRPGAPTTGDLVVGAVGDIQPGGRSRAALATGDEAAKPEYAILLGLGDYQYTDGTMEEYNAYFDVSWGRNVPKMYPVLAPNHDHYWRDEDPLHYFNGGGRSGVRAAVTLRPHTSYSFDRRGWHFVAIDDSCYRDRDSCDPADLLRWLRDDLASHPTRCTVAFMHQPYFSSTTTEHGAADELRPVVEELYAGGVDLVLTGHNHDYERFARQDPDRVADDARGLRAFVVGTGGIGLYPFLDKAPNSQARSDATHGLLRLALAEGRYSWRFVATGGAPFSDVGAEACH